MSDDPWKHRSNGMICARCVFYVKKAQRQDVAPPLNELGLPTNEIGRCRRHAPTMAGYPAVFPTDWCGDHRLDEDKL